MCFAGSYFSESVLRSKPRSDFGKPFCYCGQRHLSDLSAAARVRWAESLTPKVCRGLGTQTSKLTSISASHATWSAFRRMCGLRWGIGTLGQRRPYGIMLLAETYPGLCAESVWRAPLRQDFLRSGPGGRVVVENGVNTQAAPGSLR